MTVLNIFFLFLLFFCSKTAIIPLVLNRWPFFLFYWRDQWHLSWNLPVAKFLKLYPFLLIQGPKYLSKAVVPSPIHMKISQCLFNIPQRIWLHWLEWDLDTDVFYNLPGCFYVQSAWEHQLGRAFHFSPGHQFIKDFVPSDILPASPILPGKNIFI